MGNRFSSAKNSIAECDRCGFRFKLKILKRLVVKTKQIDMLVCPTCWEPDQPQLQLGMYPVDDPQGVRNPRPDRSYVASGPLADGFLGEGSRIIQWGWNPVGGGYTPIDGGTPNYLVAQTYVGAVTIGLDTAPPALFATAVATASAGDSVSAGLFSDMVTVLEAAMAGDFVSSAYVSGAPISTFSPGNTHPYITLSNGNLTAQSSVGAGSWSGGMSNTYHTTGKRYFEFTQTTYDTANRLTVGVATGVTKIAQPDTPYLGYSNGAWSYGFNDYNLGAYLYHDTPNQSAINVGPPVTSNGAVVGVAIDFDAGKLWFSQNGVWVDVGGGNGNPAAGTSPSYTFTPNTVLYAAVSINSNVAVVTANFGETAFSYSLPSGFTSWKTGAVLPPVSLAHYYYNTLGLLSNGNLKYAWNSGSSYGCAYATLGRSSGKYYFEIVNTQPGGLGGDTYDNWSLSGGVSSVRDLSNGVTVGSTSGAYGFSNINAAKLSTKSSVWNEGSFLEINVPQIPLNGYLGIAVDLDAGLIWFNTNGAWLYGGNPDTGTGAMFSFTPNTLMYPAMGQGSYSPYGGATINFGATAFAGNKPISFLPWDPFVGPNTLDPAHKAPNAVLSNGNLTIASATNGTGVRYSARSYVSRSAGKYYFEITVNQVDSWFWSIGGIGEGNPTDYNDNAGSLQGVSSFGLVGVPAGGYFQFISGVGGTIGLTSAINDVVMYAVDLDAGIAWVGVNGVWAPNGNPATGAPSANPYTFTPNTRMYVYGSAANLGVTTLNLGNSAFVYTPPTGFTAWGT